MGTLEPRKNLLGAVHGLRAAGLGDEVALVVAGAQVWKNEAFEREAPRAGVPLVMTGPVSDEELVGLYSGARCLVFPSRSVPARALYKNALLRRYSLGLYLTQNFVSAPATFFRAGALRELGGFDERYRISPYVALLWEFPRPHDELGVLEKLEEPSLGEPILVRHRDRAITQDLCNSALELNRIAQATGLRDFEGRTVLEVGAGYGRLVWLIAQRWPGARIVVCDIPPALAIAQWYLTSLFPSARPSAFDPSRTARRSRRSWRNPSSRSCCPISSSCCPPWRPTSR